MNSDLMLNIVHAGKCHLVSVNGSLTIDDIKIKVRNKWVELFGIDFGMHYSVGSFSNCFLESNEDISNMFALCQHISAKIVNVLLIYCNVSNFHQVVFNGVSSSVLGGECSNGISPPLGLGVECSNGKMVGSNPKFSTKSIFHGVVGNLHLGEMPCYDVCPYVKGKKLLSDAWANIMDGGIGSVFRGGAVEFRKEIIKYCAKGGCKFLFKRNDKNYVHVVCKDIDSSGCTWFIKGKLQKVSRYFEVSDCNLEHQCSGTLVNDCRKRIGPKVLSDLIIQNVKNRPELGGKQVLSLMKDGYGLDISYNRAWRSAEAARKSIYGDYEDSYNDLGWYSQAIVRTNPGSIVCLEVNKDSNRFERLFVGYKTCLDGFRSCRPMLFLDGTFMKGRSKGTILAATGKDGNNGLFPVAFAIVSSENTENWEWFLGKLRDSVTHDEQIFYLSDRNLGLMAAFNNIFSEPVHFYCLFHLLQNLKGRVSAGWSSTQRATIAERFTECAYAPSKRVFESKLAAFKEAGGKKAEEWLEQLPFEKWDVAYSPNATRFGEMTSNAAESFNSCIIEARSMPITHMLDAIRKRLCSWYVKRRQEAESWTGSLVPSKEEIWHSLSLKGSTWAVYDSGNDKYEVGSEPSVVVNLAKNSCDCYQWKISGFSCAHAVAVIRKVSNSVFGHVDDWFFTKQYSKCYENDINPIPWTLRFELFDANDVRILPPSLNRQPGRPKKKRIASYAEFPKKKKSFCNRFGLWGKHDSATCGVAVEEDAHS